jgi:beta-lactamase class D
VTLAAGVLLAAFGLPPGDTTAPAPDLREYFDGLRGGFVLVDEGSGRSFVFDSSLCSERHSPASTFKLLNALIGLETGVVHDEHTVIPWDSVERSVPAWNRDHDLASAMAVSAVPYYQEVARRIGRPRMEYWVRRTVYGNGDLSGPIDRFWLGSSLRISAVEQVEFLRRLAGDRLPYSPRSMAIVRSIVVGERTDSATVFAKTGAADEPGGTFVGWYVGWVARPAGRTFFALVVVGRNTDTDVNRIMALRKPAALRILRAMGFLP